jgi:hypothetical protein
LKVEAKKHPNFSNVCVTAGQLSHQIISRMNVLASGYRILSIAPLEREEALSKGIDFLSEAFIFVMAGGVIVIEYVRSEGRNAAKAKQQAEEEANFRNYLETKFTALSNNIEQINKKISDLDNGLQVQVNAP